MTSAYPLDLADDTFLVADPALVALVVADPASFREWWPDLHPVRTWERGLEGVRWQVTGAVCGSMEIWLEPFADGVVLHYYLRSDPVPWRAGVARKERARRSREWKQHVHALKDRLESGREPGRDRHTAVKERHEPAEFP